MSEHHMQVSLMAEVRLRANQDPVWKRIFAVPNGGHRQKGVAAAMQAEGVSKGVPDLLWPCRRGDYVGLAMELKWRDNEATDEQMEWLQWFASEGWFCIIVYDYAEDAMNVLEWYEAGADIVTMPAEVTRRTRHANLRGIGGRGTLLDVL